MKKTALRVLSLVLVLVMSTMLLCSCTKKPSGTYSAEILGIKSSYTFKGDKVTATTGVGSSAISMEGTFKMSKNDDGKQIMTITFEENGKSVSSEVSFESGKDDKGQFIKMDGLTFYKE